MEFEKTERFYRAVLPGGEYWKEDRSLSSAAFKDKKGLSTDRQMGRAHKECIAFISRRLRGSIVSVSYENCQEIEALVKYDPVTENIFHTVIIHSAESPCLTKAQARNLAKLARLDYVTKK